MNMKWFHDSFLNPFGCDQAVGGVRLWVGSGCWWGLEECRKFQFRRGCQNWDSGEFQV